jgi:pimeloyl-ACP methyl ester carboxylesterase
VAVAAALAVTVAACSGDGSHRTSASESPSSRSDVAAPPGSFMPAPLEWTECGGRVKCARLEVPLDYAELSGRKISLSVDLVPARQPDRRIGSLLINPGGPGASGLSFASGIKLDDEILDRFDIVGFDPRGVGESTPLRCGDKTIPVFREADSEPDDAAEQAVLDSTAKAVADDCGANAGDLLPYVGTDSVARDMETIRLALGEERISFYGASYGTLIGLRYLALFPKSVRAMVLDGVVDPTQDFSGFLRAQTIAFEAALNKVFDACPGGDGCPPGGARAAYDELAARVETKPISTRGENLLGPAELPVAALIPTYDVKTASIFYRGLTEALGGDATILESLFSSYERSANYPVYAAVECTDSPHPVGSGAYQAFASELIGLSPRVGGAVANELLPCAFWPAPVKDITGPVVAPEGPPVLVVGATGDAATPFQQAVTVASTLAHGRLLTFDGAGHTALGQSSCIDDAEAAYLVDLTLPPEGTVCGP